VLLHIVFITMIILSIYLIYGAWYKDFGEKAYHTNERLPTLYTWIWPKSLRKSIIAFKILAVSILVVFIVLELLLILNV